MGCTNSSPTKQGTAAATTAAAPVKVTTTEEKANPKMEEATSTLFEPFRAKMLAAGLSESAIGAFQSNFNKLVSGDTGLLPEASIDAVSTLPKYSDLSQLVEGESKDIADLLSKTCVLKLNGGLGTSMGLEKAKSLLEVKDGETFLTLICKQIKHFRAEHRAKVRFMLMNSFSTSEDTLNALKASGHDDLATEADVELMQNKSPKVTCEGTLPATNPADPELEWCPPGHGDLYAALMGSGALDRLIKQGCRYMFVSNSDNLGATLDLTLLTYFAQSKKGFLMEVAERTESDKKGGHLALKKNTKTLLLRESAMCPKDDTDAFQDITKHKFFNTNNIWLDLVQVKDVMDKNGGIMPLPLIKNKKTVDPRDSKSTPVFQLETAMGAAIESFADSGAIVVPRSRFAPVKTCSDLFALRSDAYSLTKDFRIVLNRAEVPTVVLDDKYYKLVDQMESLVSKPPSLIECDKLVVQGPVKFDQDGVVLKGHVTIVTTEQKSLASGTYSGECKL
jgi:UDP-N-acetylglucosamine pyrophosphorylase